ncbi:hypothetical protein ACFFX0_32520 [Citricoccus parietis]|uniref:Uncharacterized protein n=1 Tax=Citricoccus parietis TaxID=592307 RepID=A0ABV5G9S4_9MICC
MHSRHDASTFSASLTAVRDSPDSWTRVFTGTEVPSISRASNTRASGIPSDRNTGRRAWIFPGRQDRAAAACSRWSGTTSR